MRFFISFLGLLIGLCWSCGGAASDKQPNTPAAGRETSLKRVKVYARYMEATQSVYAEVLFEQDSIRGIDLKTEVRLNDKVMRGRDLPQIGYRYQVEFKATTLPDTFYLHYKTPEGKELREAVLMPRLANIRVPSGGFMKKTGGLIVWDGTPCAPEEGLVVRLTDKDGETYTVNHIGVTHGAELQLIEPHLAAAAPGNLLMALVRRRTITTKNEQDIAVIAVSEYYSNEWNSVLAN